MSYLGAEGDAFSRSIANALEAFRKGVDEELRKSTRRFDIQAISC